MAERYAKVSEFDEYAAFHYTAAQADAVIDVNTHGHFLKGVLVGTLGTSLVITVGNGTTNTATNVLTKITPTSPGWYPVPCACDRGVFLALTGTGFDVTIFANDMGV